MMEKIRMLHTPVSEFVNDFMTFYNANSKRAGKNEDAAKGNRRPFISRCPPVFFYNLLVDKGHNWPNFINIV